MLISYYDYLCRSEPQKLISVKLVLPLQSWASPSSLKTGGRKAKLASDFCSIVQVDYTIFKPLTQVKSRQMSTNSPNRNRILVALYLISFPSSSTGIICFTSTTLFSFLISSSNCSVIRFRCSIIRTSSGRLFNSYCTPQKFPNQYAIFARSSKEQ